MMLLYGVLTVSALGLLASFDLATINVWSYFGYKLYGSVIQYVIRNWVAKFWRCTAELS